VISCGKTFTEEIGSDRGSRFVARLDAESKDVLAALDYVVRQPESPIDAKRIAIMGWSFGGIVTTLAAAAPDRFRVAIVQAPGALNWDRSADLRSALIAAARKIRVPCECAAAENDLTTESARTICGTIKKNGVVTDLRIYPPFTPTQPIPNTPPGHLIFAREGVSIWGQSVRVTRHRTSWARRSGPTIARSRCAPSVEPARAGPAASTPSPTA
jgi:dienelactone hydrolase